MGQTIRFYPHARVRGFAPYRPQKKTQILLEQVEGVLDEYSAHLPITCRQIFYRLVGKYGYRKTVNGYDSLCEVLNRARRDPDSPIDFEAIRDDRVRCEDPGGFGSVAGFWRAVDYTARGYKRDRLADQAVRVEAWVEAGGMVPQIARVVGKYGIPVYSSGGFDSVTAKHEAACRLDSDGRQAVILHIGDHDPSGVSLFDSASEDVRAFMDGLDAIHSPEFERVAVIEEQIRFHGHPEAPPQRKDKRGAWEGGTVQAEALPPDVLAAEVEAAVLEHIDADVWRETLKAEERERQEIANRLKSVMP